MKIVLISPCLDINGVGIRILSTCLKRAGHDVKLLYLPRYIKENYGDKILDEVVEISDGAGLIGISVMTNYFDNAVQITQRLKKDFDVPIIWGGIHPTIRPEECLKYADMVCIGEVENIIVELADKIQNRRDYHNLPSVWLNHKGKIIKNKILPLPQDLDSIPFPDYDYENHYILDSGQIRKMDESLLRKYIYGYYTLATRGCPFGCSYCCNNTLNKMYANEKILRKRSVNNIIEELVQAKAKLPFIDKMVLDDDAFFMMYSVEEIADFCRKYKEKIGLPLDISGATPATLTREKLSLLVDTGLRFIRVGIQTGSDRSKRLYKRNYPNQQVEKAAGIINEFKDKLEVIMYDIIIDNPWETDEDIIETLMFLARFPPPYVMAIYSLTFYPGTELYEKAKREGIITDDLEDVYRKHFLYCKKTYLNKLFFLLNDYVRFGLRISPKTMGLLTNQKMRQLKLNWLLYGALKAGIVPVKMKYLLCEGLKDIWNGNWFRIHRYITDWIHEKTQN